MTIKSMTAFAACQQQEDFGYFSWEVRSVNNRYLDLKFRLPEIFAALEPKLKEIVKKQLNRGKVDCVLRSKPGVASAAEVKVNMPLVKQLHVAGKQIREVCTELTYSTAMDLLRWPGVILIEDTDKTKEHELIIELFEKALDDLNAMREREGEALKQCIAQRLDTISEEVEKARKVLPEILQAQRERLMNRFAEANVELDKERLEQEMVYVAQRTDVAEELDRLDAHLKETRRVLGEDDLCGRRLDFLMQEFNREANTLGSKSISPITTNVSVELKVLIEQMREQVQNLE